MLAVIVSHSGTLEVFKQLYNPFFYQLSFLQVAIHLI